MSEQQVETTPAELIDGGYFEVRGEKFPRVGIQEMTFDQLSAFQRLTGQPIGVLTLADIELTRGILFISYLQAHPDASEDDARRWMYDLKPSDLKVVEEDAADPPT